MIKKEAKYNLLKNSLTGLLLAISLGVANPSQAVYAASNASTQKDIDDDNLDHDHLDHDCLDHDHIVEALSLLSANKVTKKTSYKSNKNGTHVKTVKTVTTKGNTKTTTKTTEEEKCNIQPQIEFVDNNNGKFTIKFYRGCKDCGYKLKVYKKVVVGDYDEDSIRDYYDKKNVKPSKKLKNEFTISKNTVNSNGKGTHNRKIKIKLKNGKTYTVNIKEKHSLIPNIEFTDNFDGTHDIEFYRECDDCGYIPKVFKKTEACEYDDYGYCEYCDGINDEYGNVEIEEKNNFQIIENSYCYNHDGTHTRTIKVKLKNGKIYTMLFDAECEKISNTEYISKENGTHIAETTSECIKCDNISIHDQTEQCSYKDNECEKCHYKNKDNEHENNPGTDPGNNPGTTDPDEHEFILVEISYEKNNDGTHTRTSKLKCFCGCGEIKYKDDILDCRYNEWHMLNSIYESRECNDCNYREERGHSIQTNISSISNGDGTHVKTTQKNCVTCEYETSSSKQENCNYVNNECKDCGHEKEQQQPSHQHDWKEKNKKPESNGNGTHTITTTYVCSCGETKTETDTIRCEYGSWTSNGPTGEKRTCPTCGNEEKRGHSLNTNTTFSHIGDDRHKKTVVEDCTTCDFKTTNSKEENCNYVNDICPGCGHVKDKEHEHKWEVKSRKTKSNGDGTHTTTITYVCSCDETKTEDDTISCEYGGWTSNGEKGEINTCSTCGYEKTRNHSLDKVVTVWTYIGDNKHERKVDEECLTCDYKRTYTEQTSCNYGYEYTLSDGLTVVADCGSCGHQDTIHVHNLQYVDTENVENNPNVCYNNITGCTSCDYKITTPMPHDFRDNGFEDEGEKQQECARCGKTKWVPMSSSLNLMSSNGMDIEVSQQEISYLLINYLQELRYNLLCDFDCLCEDDRKVYCKK